jgi:trk system potassium uptake protein TrkA
MKIIICGAGQVGFGIAEQLSRENNDVSIIDTSPSLIASITETLDVRGYVGHGSHPDVLAAAGAEHADMLIAVTLSDEVNIVACEVAHASFNVPTKIARIRDQSYLAPEYADLFSAKNISIDASISPEIEVGKTVLRRIAFPGATDMVRFADDNVYFLAIECMEDCPVINTPLAQLSNLFPDLIATVVAVFRNGLLKVINSAEQLYVGDLAYVICQKMHARRTLSIFGHEEQEAQRIIIAGAGNIGNYVARNIEAMQPRTRVKIIEADKERASIASQKIKSAIVLNGSALDQQILQEADVADADLMVTLTNSDQTNILAAVMAKQLGCKSNMALLNSPSFQLVAEPMGLDAYINPRAITVSRILQHVRKGRIRSVYSIQHGSGEVVEADALATSPLVGQSLRDIDLPADIRIGAVYRDKMVLRPDGNMKIKAGDRVVLFAAADAVREVEQLFRVSIQYF